MNSNLDRKLTTILCADVSGYSRLMDEDEGKTLNHLKSTRDIFRDFIGQYGGRIVNMTGDGLVGEFSSVVKAVQCAVEIQNKINKDNQPLPPSDRMLYRIGINLGDVIIEGDDIFGEGVNVAARLEAMAPVGGICISGSVFEQIKNKLPRNFEFLGNKEVKNISDPIPVYSLSLRESPNPGQGRQQDAPSTPDNQTQGTDEDEQISVYVKRQEAFHRRVMTFGSIILFLFIINMVTSSNYWWFLWPAAAFSFILLMEAVRIYGNNPRPYGREARKTKRLKSRRKNPES
ncbi:MAG: adenylate/guanylate cyclase domain-containing protein [Sneathiella sp.]|nr:adenylate/guanylate cyclase domain-containing protein [Sneathiella sp.]